MARWMQRVLIAYWPMITAFGWACIIMGISVSCYFVYGLTQSMNMLSNQLGAVKKFSIMIEHNLRSMEEVVNENKVHLQAQSTRIGIIENRLRSLEPKNNKAAKAAALKGEQIIYREYILIPKKAPKKNATRPKKAD